MAAPLYKKVENYYYDVHSKILGKGAFATVYKATEQNTREVLAVKVIPSERLLRSEEQFKLFMREIGVLQKIKGENIVCMVDIKKTTNNLYIFTEFCDGGDLEKLIKSKHQFSEEEACSILRQIANAFITIENLHLTNSKGDLLTLMHRDIKPANILFHEGKIKVADFGFAKFIEEVNKDIKQQNTLLGTPLYMPPQILFNESYTPKCDIWSSGVLFYELLFGKLPWTGDSIENLKSNIKRVPLTFPKDVSEETKDLLTKMLKFQEEERIGWKEVYEHEALNKAEEPCSPLLASCDFLLTPTDDESQTFGQAIPSFGFKTLTDVYSYSTLPQE